jgi:hypothetical protein
VVPIDAAPRADSIASRRILDDRRGALQLIADRPVVDGIFRTKHETIVDELLARVLVIEVQRELLALVGHGLERADLGLEPGHQLAHDLFAQSKVLVEVVEQLGEAIAKRVFVFSLAERFLEHQAKQHSIVGEADDCIVGIFHRVLGRHDVHCDAGSQLARGARQVLVVHSVERNLQVMR